ncbi:MAG: arginine deiminase [Streptosporangiaceae bacterium]
MGDNVGSAHGVNSEVGGLRTVLVHRPGPELRRITPRHRDRLVFGTVPWAARAQQEHDIFAQALRDHGAEVLYVTELLQDVLEYDSARNAAVASVLADGTLGAELRGQLKRHLDQLGPEELAHVLIAGLTPDELRSGRGVVFELLGRGDFVIEPLPNLVFCRDSSFWIGDQVAVASPAAAHRRREAELLGIIYATHPRFAGTTVLYGPAFEHVEGGDVLLLGPQVVAVGVGSRTTAAGLERLARRLFRAGLAHTVLAVPLPGGIAASHLDTVCTAIDASTVLMHPALAYSLTAHLITPRPDGMRVSRPQPLLAAAADALGIDQLHVIETGLDPLTGPSQQWDDGGNALVIGHRLVLSSERNVDTNARLERSGVAVLRVPASELGGLRGGPRCLSCPAAREQAGRLAAANGEPGRGQVVPPRRELAAVTSVDPPQPAQGRQRQAAQGRAGNGRRHGQQLTPAR